MKKIALFGGSFDPVHTGHLWVARAAIEELELDRIFCIPAFQSPFKPGQRSAPPELRLRMLRLAFAGFTRAEVDDLEIRRGGISFSIETVDLFHERFPGATLYYLIGADHILTLPQWRDASRLATRVEFVAIPRPGDPVGLFPEGFHGRVLHGFPVGISSSQIRQRIREGRPVDGLVPDAVAEVIRNNQLYL